MPKGSSTLAPDVEQPSNVLLPYSGKDVLRVSTDTFQVTAKPHPILSNTVYAEGLEGQTIHQLARAAGIEGFYVAYLNGSKLDPWHCQQIRPKRGTNLVIKAVAQGGGGGNGRKAIAAVLQVVIAIVSVFTFGAALAAQGVTLATASTLQLGLAAAAGAAVSMVGGLAISALVRPQTTSIPTYNDPTVSSISGTRNNAVPYGTLPQVLGRVRMFPLYIGKPFTEIEGSDQYLRVFLTFGYGPLSISDIRIGETPITEYDGVEYEWRPGADDDTPITIFPNSVHEESLSVELPTSDFVFIEQDISATTISITNTGVLSVDAGTPFAGFEVGDIIWVRRELHNLNIGYHRIAEVLSSSSLQLESKGPYRTDSYVKVSYGPDLRVILARLTKDQNWVQRRSRQGATELSVDLSMPSGLVKYDDTSGGRRYEACAWEISYKAADASVWTYVDMIERREKTPTLVRVSKKWSVTAGQYDVRVRQISRPAPNDSVKNLTIWSALRTITGSDPVIAQNVSKLAMRIKATGQLNNVLDSVNAIVQTQCLDWNGAEWVLQATSNPASLYRHILQGRSNPRPVLDAKIDLDTLADWHEACTDGNRAFNAVLESSKTLLDTLIDVAAIGYATFAYSDGLFSVIQDKPQDTPVQLFTPRNSWNFEGRKTFRVQPHGLRVKFTNPDTNWDRDEAFVYADGYDDTNATYLEAMETIGITNHDQAWRYGRYMLAQAKLRPETYSLMVDIEHLVVQRGDLVRVTHDVPLFGLGYARVVSTTLSGSDVTAIDLDHPVTMESGKDYAVRIRRVNGTQVYATVTTVAGDQDELTFATPITGITADDLVVFGEAGSESVEMIVKAIEPKGDLAAILTLLDAAPAVHTADTGLIPEHDSQVSIGGASGSAGVTAPVISSVSSTEDDEPTIRVAMGALQSQAGFIPVSYQLQFKEDESQTWESLPPFPIVQGTLIIEGVEKGQVYDIRVRIIGSDGSLSPWRTVEDFVVEGDPTRPANPLNLRLDGTDLVWTYLSPPANLAGFYVRVDPSGGSSWEDAAKINPRPITDTRLNVQAYLSKGTKRFFVKAVTTQGVESEGSASLLKVITEEYGRQVVVFQDHVDEDFVDGTITNGSVVSDELVADVDAAGVKPFWALDYEDPDDEDTVLNSPAFWLDDSFDFWLNTPVYDDLVFETTFNPTLASGAGPYRVTTVTTFAGKRPRVEYKFQAGDEWEVWPGTLHGVQEPVSIIFRVTIPGTDVQGKITAFTIYVDSSILEETFVGQVVSPGGTRLTLTRPFTNIVQVGDIRVYGESSSNLSIPIGTVIYAPTVLSSDFLECNGQTVSRSTYAQLWSYASSNSLVDNGNDAAFGTGDGSMTFTLPDWSGLFIVASSPAGSTTPVPYDPVSNGIVNVTWKETSGAGTATYTEIDDGTRQPSVPNTADLIYNQVAAGDPDDGSAIAVFGFNTSAVTTGATKITVWVYGDRTNSWGQVHANITVNGVSKTKTAYALDGTASWHSIEFTDTWTQADLLAGVTVTLENVVTGGGVPSHVRVYAMYVDITPVAAAAVNVLSTGGAASVTLTAEQSGLPVHGHSATGGSHTHTVTDPGHGHSVTDPGHTHTVTADAGSHTHTLSSGATNVMVLDAGGSYGAATGTDFIMDPVTITANTSTHNHTLDAGGTTGISIVSATTGISLSTADAEPTIGDSAADTDAEESHENRPPFVALKILMKVTSPGGGNLRAIVVDKNVSLGPLLKILDDVGNDIGGTLDCTVKGY